MPEVTFAGTPEWYGGQTGIIKNLANRAHQVTTTGFKPYPNDRIAPFTPLQQQSFDLGKKEVTNPGYERLFKNSTGAIRNALGQDISGELQPFIDRGIANPVENAQDYMNPYNQEVTENIGRLASRNLTENILPNINDQFIRSGSYGSSGGPGSRSHQDITGRAIRDTQDAVARAQAESLQSGYNKALETSVGQQERNLQAGRLFGGAKAEDAQRNILGGRELQNLSSQYQGERRQGIGLLGQLGNQQQQQGQQGLNTAFADWQSERNYPYIQAARESELVRGLTPGQYTSSTASYMPQAPQASPWSQGAGLLTGLVGAANQRQGFSEGGSVNDRKMKLMNSVAHLRHYADGGSVPLSPIQRGVNDALDTSEIQSMRAQANKLDQMQVNPFWSAIARTGFNMASKRTPGVLANLGEAANEGMNEYQGQLTNQTNREMAASKLREMIDNTLRWQADRNRQHELNKEKFGHEKSLDERKLKLLQSKEGREQAEYEKTKNLIEGPGKMLYQLDNDEKGNQIAKPLEGMSFTPSKTKTTKQINEEKKANEEALQEWNATLGTANEEKRLLDEFEELNKSVGTNELEAFLSDYGVTQPLSNIMKSLRVGKTDIDTQRSLSEALSALRIGRLKGKQSTVAHQQTIKATKPQEKYSRKTNESIVNRDREKLAYNTGEAEFGTKIFNKYKDPNTGDPIFSASQIKKAYKDWKEAKGDKNLQTPEDYLEAMAHEETYGTAREDDNSESNNEFISKLSDEQKQLRTSLGLGG